MAVTCTGEGRVLRAAISGEVDHHRARAIMEELSRQIDLARTEHPGWPLTEVLSGIKVGNYPSDLNL